jgi:hypothetical protein
MRIKTTFSYFFLATKMKLGEIEKLYLMDIFKNMPLDIAFVLPIFFGRNLT